mmetsp:Transcript_21548/g.24749  ORF Transcript_21548/g.24749 Transcript_21548/m.24749 type:complete len:105 (-) Transcript_21548:3-317(-)
MSHYLLPNDKKERHTKGGSERKFSHSDGWDCNKNDLIVSHGVVAACVALVLCSKCLTHLKLKNPKKNFLIDFLEDAFDARHRQIPQADIDDSLFNDATSLIRFG